MSKESVRDLTLKALKVALDVKCTEWRKASDPPADEVPVLVAYENAVSGELIADQTAKHYKGRWYWHNGFPICISTECMVNITHWMPLPEPPTK